MDKESYPCPEKGTLDLLVESLKRISLLAILIEAKEDETFIQEIKTLFYKNSPINTALSKIISTKEQFPYLEPVIHDLVNTMIIFTNLAQDQKASVFLQAEKKRKSLLAFCDYLTEVVRAIETIQNNLFPNSPD